MAGCRCFKEIRHEWNEVSVENTSAEENLCSVPGYRKRKLWGSLEWFFPTRERSTICGWWESVCYMCECVWKEYSNDWKVMLAF